MSTEHYFLHLNFLFLRKSVPNKIEPGVFIIYKIDGASDWPGDGAIDEGRSKATNRIPSDRMIDGRGRANAATDRAARGDRATVIGRATLLATGSIPYIE